MPRCDADGLRNLERLGLAFDRAQPGDKKELSADRKGIEIELTFGRYPGKACNILAKVGAGCWPGGSANAADQLRGLDDPLGGLLWRNHKDDS